MSIRYDNSSFLRRADAYMKMRQWDLAVRDLTTAISLQIDAACLLMNINQFRALYPEYKAASDEAVARKLNQTFYPEMKYEEFSKGLLHNNKAWPSTVVPDLYLRRADAYLKAGNWHKAAMDFRRAVNGFPEYADAVDRWREIGSLDTGSRSRHLYIDLKTFDDANNTSVKLWLKQTKSSEGQGPYSVQRYELNCESRQMRTLSVASYDALGNLNFTREGGPQWESIVPDTMGEQLTSGACQSN